MALHTLVFISSLLLPLISLGFSDVDRGSNPDDCWSTSGDAVYMGYNLISWCAKKQKLVAHFSTESEYRALAEVWWLQHLPYELHIPQSTCLIIWCDNISTTSFAMNPVFHSHTKHIELDLHFVHDKILLCDLQVHFVPTHDQIADIFTKPLSASRF